MKQEQALNKMKSGENIFLTGPPGSGKTYLLRKFVSYLRENDVNVGVTASTGIAATHLEGRTIHSWSGVGINDKLTGEDMERILKKPKLKDRIVNSEVLIIDEISMMSPVQFGLADLICKRARNDASAFGGLQVILSGDFFQLPPVKEEEFVTETDTWQELGLDICYLEGQYRQIDDKLTKILKEIRREEVTEASIELLEGRERKDISFTIDPTRLYTHNADVDSINKWELEKLEGDYQKYELEREGPDGLVSMLENSCLVAETLKLKKGANVMFVKNDFDQGYVNGTLGKVVDFSGFGTPVVKINQGDKIQVYPKSWRLKEMGKTKAEIKQIPLRLAWAITVHKSQGMTLDCADIDLSKAFEEGMGYVALSRVKSLDGISLRGFNETALKVSKQAVKLDKRFRKFSD